MDNKTLVRRLYDEAFSAGELDAIDELVAADAIEHEEVPGSTGDTRADLKAFIAEFRGAFPDLVVEVEDLLAEDDRVAARVNFRGTHRGAFMDVAATGATVTLPVIDIMRLSGGQVVEHWGAFDTSALMTQLTAAGD